MATLMQKLLHFNRSIQLSSDGGALSSDTGELIFREFEEKLGFSQTITQYLQLKDERSYYIHSNEQLLHQKIYQLIAGFHPLLAFDGLTGDFLKAKLCSGKVYTSNGTVDFLQPLLIHYNETFPETSTLVRGDSGFAVPGLYDLCEQESVYYIIRLKSNAKLRALAEELHPVSEIQDVTKMECYVEESIYQAKSWSKARRIIIQSTRPAGELFFFHAFL